MPLRIRGATSGYTEVIAPAVAAGAIVTLPNKSGTLPTLEGGNSFTGQQTVDGIIKSLGLDANIIAQCTTGSAALALASNTRYWRWLTSNSDYSLRLNDETAGKTRIRIATGGDISFGKEAASEAASSGPGFGFGSVSTDPFFSVVSNLGATGNAQIYLNRRNPGYMQIFMSNDGVNNVIVGSISHNGSATAYNTTSDYRLKESLQPIASPTERLMALNPVNFAWKQTGDRVDGFIAHEVQAVVPEAVTGRKDEMRAPTSRELEEGLHKEGDLIPEYQGIDQAKLVPLLTAALQDAIHTINNLKARVEALEAGA